MAKTFKIGDKVSVRLPGGKYAGEIMDVMPNWGFYDRQETKYRVQGYGFDTITSERCLEAKDGFND